MTSMRMPTEDELNRTLRLCVAAFEELENDQWTETCWEAYQAVREFLGDPVKMYPGGYENSHFHFYGWVPEDGCCSCDDYAEDERQAEKAANAQPG